MAKLACTELVMLVSLLYVIYEIQYGWDNVGSCSRPLDVWLQVSYVLFFLSRVVYVAGMLLTNGNSGDFMLNLRHPTLTLQAFFWFTWLVLLPFFSAWSVIGSFWIMDAMAHTEQCMPSGMTFWLLMGWQMVNYLWVLIHIGLFVLALLLEWRLRTFKKDLRRVMRDASAEQRWNFAIGDGYATSLSHGGMRGLSPDAIRELPGIMDDVSQSTDAEDCAICLEQLCQGCDSVRMLKSCGHVFHRSCIDLWLLRCANCPLCKCTVAQSPISDIEGCRKRESGENEVA